MKYNIIWYNSPAEDKIGCMNHWKRSPMNKLSFSTYSGAFKNCGCRQETTLVGWSLARQDSFCAARLPRRIWIAEARCMSGMDRASTWQMANGKCQPSWSLLFTALPQLKETTITTTIYMALLTARRHRSLTVGRLCDLARDRRVGRVLFFDFMSELVHVRTCSWGFLASSLENVHVNIWKPLLLAGFGDWQLELRAGALRMFPDSMFSHEIIR